MNEAVNNQRDAPGGNWPKPTAGQLALVRDRLDTFWEKRAAGLDRLRGPDQRPPASSRWCAAGAADSVICLNRDGAPAYPLPCREPSPRQAQRTGWAEHALGAAGATPPHAAAAYAKIAKSEQDPQLAGRAVQAQVRCLMQSGDKDRAARVIERAASRGPARCAAGSCRDASLPPTSNCWRSTLNAGPRQARPAARRLATLLNDYAGTPMPSAQRLFLMDELRALGPGRRRVSHLRRRATRRAVSGRPGGPPGRPRAATQRPCRSLEARLARAAAPSRFTAARPSSPPCARFLNGLDVALTFQRRPAGRRSARRRIDARRRTPAGLAHLAVARRTAGPSTRWPAARWRRMSGRASWRSPSWPCWLIAARRRSAARWRLARLKSDLVATVSHELKTPLASMRLLVDTLLERRLPTRKSRARVSRD